MMPGWMTTMMKYGWGKKISPFGIARFAGKKRSLKAMGRYADRRNVGEDAKDTIRDYLYQIIMRPGTTEYALMVNFEIGLVCKLPLEDPSRLANQNLPFSVSFIYGDNDWVAGMEGESPQRAVDAQLTGPNALRSHNLKCPGSGHNLHMDNPIGVTNMLINEFLQENLPVTAPVAVEEDAVNDYMTDVDSVAQDTDNIPMDNQAELEMPLIDVDTYPPDIDNKEE